AHPRAHGVPARARRGYGRVVHVAAAGRRVRPGHPVVLPRRCL
ncbi:MAG: hypothetical protein AVDCRST_MAG06-2455, partial [uncultured Nocardioides sp.]